MVSVVVVARQAEAIIERTLRALSRSKYTALEIVVVDDGSTDATARLVQQAAMDDVRIRMVRRTPGNRSTPLDVGFAEATGDIVITVDAGAAVRSDTVGILVHRLGSGASSPAVVVAATEHVNLRSLVRRAPALAYLLQIGVDRVVREMLDGLMTVPDACVAWNRSMVRRAGGFTGRAVAARFDLCLELQGKGRRVVPEPDAVVDVEVPKALRSQVSMHLRWTVGTLDALWRNRTTLVRPRLGWRGVLIGPVAVVLVGSTAVVVPAVLLLLVLALVGQDPATIAAGAVVAAACHVAVVALTGVTAARVRLVASAVGAVALTVAASQFVTTSGGRNPDQRTEARAIVPPSVDRAAAVRMAGTGVASWVRRNVPARCRVVAEAELRAQLLEAGRGVARTVTYRRANDLLRRQHGAEDPCADGFVVIGGAFRQWSGAGTFPELRGRLDDAELVARFGSGRWRMDVFSLVSAGSARARAERADERARERSGAELASNTRLDVSAEAGDDLLNGQVDSRLLGVLPLLASEYSLRLESFPLELGEQGLDMPRRSVRITQVNGRPVAASREVRDLIAVLDAQPAPYRPARIDLRTRQSVPVLLLEYRLPAPIGLLS